MTRDLKGVRPGNTEWRIGLLNGVNVANIGRRNKAVYGSVESLEALEIYVGELAESLGVKLVKRFASNHEGAILDWIHAEGYDLDGILFNPGGLVSYGLPTRQALTDTGVPVIEVHFSNLAAYGYTSIFSPHVVGTVAGLRKHSYAAGLTAMVSMLDDGDFVKPSETNPYRY